MSKSNSQQINVLANQLVEYYQQAELEIAKKLQGDLTQWKTSYLKQRQKEVKAILDNLKMVSNSWTNQQIPNLYKSGIILADSRLPKGKVGMSNIHQENVVRLTGNLMKDLTGSIEYVGRRVDDIFRSLSLKSLMEGSIEGENRRKATERLVKSLEKNGISSFQDKVGREWNLKSYSEMVIRTTSRESTNTGLKTRMVERGYDLVEITSHSDACDKCEPFEGQIFSLTGETKGYPTLDEAEAEGLFHPNCIHVPVPYIE